MATKKIVKKANKPTMGNMPRHAKMIDLEQARVSPAIRKMVNAVNSELKMQAKMSTIPVFQLLGPKTLSVETYFLNNLDYSALLGSNMDILDRMMMSSICKVLADDIMESIEDAEVTYVGVWDTYTVYNILAAIVTFMKHDTTTERYFTAQQYVQISQEDLEQLSPGSYMPFSEYNPNRFIEQLIIIRRVAIDTIAGIIENKIPKAFMSSKSLPLAIRLYNSYKSMMEADMKLVLGEMNTVVYAEQPATEKKIRTFTDYFEKPFLTMMTLFMKESGLSDNVIKMALGTSKIHIIYDDPGDRTIGEVSLNYNMLSTGLPDGIEPVQVGFQINIADAIEMACVDPATLTKSRKEAFGKNLRTMILSMCTYIINVYTKLMEHNNKKEEVATSGYAEVVEPKPAAPEVQDMDVSELADLLN